MEYCPKGDRWPWVRRLIMAPLTLARSDTFVAVPDMDEPAREWLRTTSNCYVSIVDVFGNRTTPRPYRDIETCGPVPYLETKYRAPHSSSDTLPLPAPPTASLKSQTTSPSPSKPTLALPDIGSLSTVRSTLATLPKSPTSSASLLPLATIGIPKPTSTPLPAPPTSKTTRAPKVNSAFTYGQLPAFSNVAKEQNESSRFSAQPLTAFSRSTPGLSLTFEFEFPPLHTASSQSLTRVPAHPSSDSASKFSLKPLTAFSNTAKATKESARFSLQPLTAFARSTPSTSQTLQFPPLHTASSQSAARVPAHPSSDSASKFSLQPLTAFSNVGKPSKESTRFSLQPLTAFAKSTRSIASAPRTLPLPLLTALPSASRAPAHPSSFSKPTSKFVLQPLTAF
jgi:hypothetical protein